MIRPCLKQRQEEREFEESSLRWPSRRVAARQVELEDRTGRCSVLQCYCVVFH